MASNGVCPVDNPVEECAVHENDLGDDQQRGNSSKRDRSLAKAAGGASSDGGPPTTRARTSRAVNAAAVEGSDKFQLFAKYGSLYDQNGTEIVLKGMSWFGFEFSTESKKSTCNILNGLWDLKLGPTLDEIAAEGFNLLRLPVDYVLAWDAGEAGNAPGSIVAAGWNEHKNPELKGKKTLQVLDWVIDECAQRGILILFDMQRNDGGKSKANATKENPDQVPALWFDGDWPLTAEKGQKSGTEAWKRLLRRYKNAWNVIGADLKNEPHEPAYWGSADDNNPNNWHQAAVHMASEILSEGPLRKFTIWVEGLDGGMNWGSNLKGPRSMPIKVADTPLKDKLVYSMHCYGPDVVEKSAWWRSGSITNVGGQTIEQKWDEEWGAFKDQQGVPVILGEWMGKSVKGTVDDDWTQRFVAYLRGKDAAANGRQKDSDANPNDANNRWKHSIVWSFNNNDGDTGGLVAAGPKGDQWSNGDGKPAWRAHKLEYLAQVCPFPTKIRPCPSGLFPKTS